MVHSLPSSGQVAAGQAVAPGGWSAPSGAAMSNPFAAFSVQIGSAETVSLKTAAATKTLSLAKPAGDKPRLISAVSCAVLPVWKPFVKGAALSREQQSGDLRSFGGRSAKPGYGLVGAMVAVAAMTQGCWTTPRDNEVPVTDSAVCVCSCSRCRPRDGGTKDGLCYMGYSEQAFEPPDAARDHPFLTVVFKKEGANWLLWGTWDTRRHRVFQEELCDLKQCWVAAFYNRSGPSWAGWLPGCAARRLGTSRGVLCEKLETVCGIQACASSRWDDGKGEESLGCRKSLGAFQVLVCLGDGGRDEVQLSWKIVVKEGQKRRTLAFVGHEDPGPRVLVCLRSAGWILTSYDHGKLPRSPQPSTLIGAAEEGSKMDMMSREEEIFWGLFEALSPEAVHVGLPCEHYSVSGLRQPDASDQAIRSLVIQVLLAQDKKKCGRPDALASLEHPHRPVQGSVKVEVSGGTKWMGMGILSGVYEPACCQAYVKALKRSLGDKPVDVSGGCIKVGSCEVVSFPAPGSSKQVVTTDELSQDDRTRLDKEIKELSEKMAELWRLFCWLKGPRGCFAAGGFLGPAGSATAADAAVSWIAAANFEVQKVPQSSLAAADFAVVGMGGRSGKGGKGGAKKWEWRPHGVRRDRRSKERYDDSPQAMCRAMSSAYRHGGFGHHGNLDEGGWITLDSSASLFGVSVTMLRQALAVDAADPRRRFESRSWNGREWVRAKQGHSTGSGMTDPGELYELELAELTDGGLRLVKSSEPDEAAEGTEEFPKRAEEEMPGGDTEESSGEEAAAEPAGSNAAVDAPPAGRDARAAAPLADQPVAEEAAPVKESSSSSEQESSSEDESSEDQQSEKAAASEAAPGPSGEASVGEPKEEEVYGRALCLNVQIIQLAERWAANIHQPRVYEMGSTFEVRSMAAKQMVGERKLKGILVATEIERLFRLPDQSGPGAGQEGPDQACSSCDDRSGRRSKGVHPTPWAQGSTKRTLLLRAKSQVRPPGSVRPPEPIVPPKAVRFRPVKACCRAVNPPDEEECHECGSSYWESTEWASDLGSVVKTREGQVKRRHFATLLAEALAVARWRCVRDDESPDSETEKRIEATLSNLPERRKRKRGGKKRNKKKVCKCGKTHHPSRGHKVPRTVHGVQPVDVIRIGLRKALVNRWWKRHFVPSKLRNKLQHCLNGNGPSVYVTARLLFAASLVPLAWKARCPTSQCVWLKRSRRPRLQQCRPPTPCCRPRAKYVVCAAVLVIGVGVLWWLGRVLANKLARSYHGNSLPAKLIELKDGESVWEITGPPCFGAMVEKAKGLMPASSAASSGSQEEVGCFALSRKKAAGGPLAVLHKDAVGERAVQKVDAALTTVGSTDGSVCEVIYLKDDHAFVAFSEMARGLTSGSQVYLRAYILDQPNLVGIIMDVLARTVRVHIVADQGQPSGRTKTQWQRLTQLSRGGAQVVLCKGRSVQEAYKADRRQTKVGGGLLRLHHAKSVVFSRPTGEKSMIIGSCNWTTSSKSNREAGVLIHAKDGNASKVFQEWMEDFELAVQAGTSLGEIEEVAQSSGKG
eukprot:Skav225122  [mRNA]  locus=scaffold1239:300159:312588:- [translate_table: standard]